MGIRSTSTIDRSTAITRIALINDLIANKDCRELDLITYECDYDLLDFVLNSTILYIPLENWTNKMLSDKMDDPFYRESMFDNYIVVDDT